MSISLFPSSGSGAAAWQDLQNWRAKRNAASSDFESSSTILMTTLAGATSSSSDGLIEITMRKAVAAARQRVSERIALMGEEGRSLNLMI